MILLLHAFGVVYGIRIPAYPVLRFAFETVWFMGIVTALCEYSPFRITGGAMYLRDQ
jgi:hypothetical protein